tara:strand:+ start:2537 stop:3430 length:894 start_codon:yes stop_codon:yes gene_type:complete
MGRIADWLQFFRWGNCLNGLIGVFLGAIMVIEGIPSGKELQITTLLAISVSSFMGSWNGLNDYVDIEIDKINRPNRPLPSGRISISSARSLITILMFTSFASLLSAANIAQTMTSDFTTWYPTIAIWFFAIFLLVNYESTSSFSMTLKDRGLPGNIAISLSVGLVILYGAAGVFDVTNPKVISLFFVGFLFNTAREIIKDVEDMLGDEGRYTLAMRVGPDKARLTAWVLLLLTMISLILPFSLGIFETKQIILIGPALFVLMGVKKHIALAEDTAASRQIKISMTLAILGLIVTAFI